MFALTPRLCLRPGWPEDAAELARAIGFATVVTNLACVPWPYGEDDAGDFLSSAWAEPGPRFLILERADGRLIGCIEATGGVFGYWLTPDAWGRGYATEAGRAVIAIARDTLRLPSLKASWFIDNPASGRVLTKLGFRETGRSMQPSLARGAAVPSVMVELDLTERINRPLPVAA